MSKLKKLLIFLSLSMSIIFLFFTAPAIVDASSGSNPISFVILSDSLDCVRIGDEFYPICVTTNEETPVWKSSRPSVATVDETGKVTAKKAGTTTIKVTFPNAEASCKITVAKTSITLNKTAASIEHGETVVLSAKHSTSSAITWKSSKKSVAIVDENGVVTGLKPGTTTITASADGSKATCTITVKSPSLSLNHSSVTLYRGQTLALITKVSSNLAPSFKSNKKSVATVDQNGVITAVKHGTATITATIDGVSKTCAVTVKQPEISLNTTEISLTPGNTYQLKANVSSKNAPAFSSSNSAIATVDSNGCITAIQTGTAYIYVQEDGVKVKCKVKVIPSGSDH